MVMSLTAEQQAEMRQKILAQTIFRGKKPWEYVTRNFHQFSSRFLIKCTVVQEDIMPITWIVTKTLFQENTSRPWRSSLPLMVSVIMTHVTSDTSSPTHDMLTPVTCHMSRDLKYVMRYFIRYFIRYLIRYLLDILGYFGIFDVNFDDC